ncbi:hypothetical protein ACWDG1_09245 [Streptomyces sp. NPDC001177]
MHATAHLLDDSELARIDAAADEYRRIAGILADGGFSGDGIRHGLHANAGRACPDSCLTCRNARAHANCYGCPDC